MEDYLRDQGGGRFQPRHETEYISRSVHQAPFSLIGCPNISLSRGAGGAHKASWMKAIKTGSTVSEAVATPVKAVSVHGAVPDVGLAPHVDIDADVDGLGEVKDRQSGSDHFATGGDDDVGALVGRATPVTLKPIEKTVVMEESTQAGDEGGGQGGSKAVKGVAKSGKATQRAGRESGGNAGAQQQQQQKKQVLKKLLHTDVDK